ncbi:MAG: V-type ATP synthase subunit I [Promethearchaeota archaeon]
MFLPEKMARVKIDLNKRSIPELIETLINFRYFHVIEKTINQPISTKEPIINTILTEEQQNEIEDRIKIIRNYLNDIIEQVGITQKTIQNLNVTEENKISINFKGLNEYFNEISFKAENIYYRWKRLIKRLNEIDSILENIAEIAAFINLVSKFGGEKYNPKKFNRLNFETFVCNKNQYFVLQNAIERMEHPIVYYGEEIGTGIIGFFVFYEKEYENQIKDLIVTYNCKKVFIPDKYIDKNGLHMERVQKDHDYELELRKKHAQEYKKFIETIPLVVLGLSEALSNGIKIFNIYKGFQKLFSKNLTSIEGYVPLKMIENFKEQINLSLGKEVSLEIVEIERSCPYEEEEETKERKETFEFRNIEHSKTIKIETKQFKEQIPSRKKQKKQIERKKKHIRYEKISANKIDPYEKPPTFLKLNKFVDPYLSLVNLYGITNYSEIDPTAFLVITFTLLFGLMFGDVGHGLVLIIVGLLGIFYYKGKKNKNGRRFAFVMIYCGLGAIIGGLLYGEWFGYPLIIAGKHFILLAEPMENVTLLIKISIILGVIIIVLGWIISFINYYINKYKFMAFADPFIKILIIVGGTYLIFNYMFDIQAWLSPPYPILLVIIPSIFYVFIRIFGKLFKVASYLKKKSYGSMFSQTFLEYFETMLQIISNVASFIRILALEMAHIGLMLVVIRMTELTNTTAGWYIFFVKPLILTLGNAFVIILEVILVLIHGMRLHFYEFFSKFYVADGIPFNEIILDNTYSKINFIK